MHALTETSRRGSVRVKLMATLFVAQVCGSTGHAIGMAVGSIMAASITRTNTWSGLPIAVGALGTALASWPLARLMARSGRRPGLALGYALAMIGAVLGLWGVAGRSFTLMLIGMALFGIASTSNLLARYAAADVSLPARRGRAMGLIVWGSTVGSMIGPNLMAPALSIGALLGVPATATPFLISGASYTTAALGLARGSLRAAAGDRGGRAPADLRGGPGRDRAGHRGGAGHPRALPERGRLESGVRGRQRPAHRRARAGGAGVGAGLRGPAHGLDGRDRGGGGRHDPGALGLRDPERAGRGAGTGPARGHLAETTRARFPVEPELMLRLFPDLPYLGAGTLLNSLGIMGDLVVLGWLALELTDSPFLVGAAMGARALPLFFVGVPAGVIADRLPRHRLLIATGAGQAVATALMSVLALTGAVSLAQLVLLTFVGGILRGLEHAARQSYAHDVVGAAGLLSGLAILGVAMRTGWLVGSLVAGAIIARYGSGHAYLFVAAAYLAGGLAMLPARAVTAAAPGAAHSSSRGG